MDATPQLESLLEALERFGVDLRWERLGGCGGGHCRVGDKTTMFIDLDADLATRLERCVDALAALPEIDLRYLIPTLRALIERRRTSAVQPFPRNEH